MEEGADAKFCPPNELAAIPVGWEEDQIQSKTTLREFPLTNAAGGRQAEGTPEGELARGD